MEINLPEFQCPHQRNNISESITLDDFRPISPIELSELMLVAIRSNDFRIRAKIQSRLSTAVPGQTCPRRAFDIVGKKVAKIDSLYMNELRTGPNPGFIENFFQIINQ